MKILIKVLVTIAVLITGWLFLVRFLRKPMYKDKSPGNEGPMFMSQHQRTP
jgi:hypothetical protein